MEHHLDEHADVLGADTMPAPVRRVPHAVWINRPGSPHRRAIAVVGVAVIACCLLGLAGIVVAAGADVLDIVARATATPLPVR
jgi:hypothetical protein